jgi:hypothetical protein
VYVLTKDEGGRHKPFFSAYSPQFYFRTTDVTGTMTLPADKEMVMPGDNTSMSVELIAPIAMEEGLRFAIREGGRTVGAGRVTKDHQVARCPTWGLSQRYGNSRDIGSRLLPFSSVSGSRARTSSDVVRRCAPPLE